MFWAFGTQKLRVKRLLATKEQNSSTLRCAAGGSGDLLDREGDGGGDCEDRADPEASLQEGRGAALVRDRGPERRRARLEVEEEEAVRELRGQRDALPNNPLHCKRVVEFVFSTKTCMPQGLSYCKYLKAPSCCKMKNCLCTRKT